MISNSPPGEPAHIWPLGPPAQLQAPAAWACIDFISDVHLCEPMPATFAAWQGYVQRTRANAVLILGDLFELWAGDDSAQLGFPGQCIRTLCQASQRLALGLMHGNRDFLMGSALMQACGATALADPTVLHAFGQRIMLTHGDALCLEDTAYQAFRLQVRAPAWQQACLAQPLSERLALAARMRQASQDNHDKRRFDGLMQGDIDLAATHAWLADHQCETLVHGHTHKPSSGPLDGLEGSATRHVLTDWDCEGTRPRGEVLRLTQAGFARIPLERA